MEARQSFHFSSMLKNRRRRALKNAVPHYTPTILRLKGKIGFWAAFVTHALLLVDLSMTKVYGHSAFCFPAPAAYLHIVQGGYRLLEDSGPVPEPSAFQRITSVVLARLHHQKAAVQNFLALRPGNPYQASGSHPLKKMVPRWYRLSPYRD